MRAPFPRWSRRVPAHCWPNNPQRRHPNERSPGSRPGAAASAHRLVSGCGPAARRLQAIPTVARARPPPSQSARHRACAVPTPATRFRRRCPPAVQRKAAPRRSLLRADSARSSRVGRRSDRSALPGARPARPSRGRARPAPRAPGCPGSARRAGTASGSRRGRSPAGRAGRPLPQPLACHGRGACLLFPSQGERARGQVSPPASCRSPAGSRPREQARAKATAP